MLCEGLTGEEISETIAGRIRASLSAPMAFDHHTISADASIGIAVAAEPTITAAELLRCADAAMFRAKERGGARCEVFHESLRGQMLDQLAMIPGLRDAVSAGELLLHYQPTVALGSGMSHGVEALVRWQRPGAGLLSPASFVPLAEQTGLITSIDTWVLRSACRQLASWQQHADVDDSFTMSVNVSARRLAEPELDYDVRQVLDEEQVDPSGLCLEITETALLRDASHAARTLEALRSIGVRIAVDDFGTGYSSLAHLRRLPIDIIKVDQSFVSGLSTNPQDEAIVAAVIDLSRALDLVTVAEGVETEQQNAVLCDLGCELAQGFFFSRPLPIAEMDAQLRAAS